MTHLTPLNALLANGRHANHPVCHDGQRLVPWSEFSERVRALAAGFADRPELRWLLAADSPLTFATLFFALLHAGKRIVIPPNTQAATEKRLASAFDAVANDTVRGRAAPLGPINPQTAAIDLYTSGSTGEPKCVSKTLAQFETEVATLEALWGRLLGMAAIVATAPHSHFYGLLFRLIWPLSAGRVFDSVTCADPDTLNERLAVLGDCALVSSPAQLSRLPELMSLGALQSIPRLIFSSGGPLPAAAASAYHRQLGKAPTEVFGSTETGGIAWRRQEGDDAWTPFPGMQVTADNDHALLLRSPFLGSDQPATGIPWRMDDAVELLPDGRFRLRGRLDRTVKIEEKRLSLPELEARLGEHPWVATAAATALGGRRQHIGAALILNTEGNAHLLAHGKRSAVRHLRNHLAAHFEPVLLPRRWRFPQQLPVNERGKLTQAALNALFSNAADDDEHAPA
jgi:acyl-coenzyme A synthetase/AMP-(fatty) acid ligase